MLALHYSRRRSPQPARLVRLVLMRSLCLLRVLRDAPAVLALRYGYISRFYNAYIVALRYGYIYQPFLQCVSVLWASILAL